MSDYFYAPQNDLAAVIGGATRGLATALAGRPIWQAQARETGARAALYGAQTGYYQTKTQIEREQERRLSNLIITSAPDLANWASGKDVSPDGQQRINTMMLEAARADPNAFLQVPQLAASMARGGFGMTKNITTAPGEQVFTPWGKEIARSSMESAPINLGSAYSAALNGLGGAQRIAAEMGETNSPEVETWRGTVNMLERRLGLADAIVQQDVTGTQKPPPAVGGTIKMEKVDGKWRIPTNAAPAPTNAPVLGNTNTNLNTALRGAENISLDDAIAELLRIIDENSKLPWSAGRDYETNEAQRQLQVLMGKKKKQQQPQMEFLSKP